MLIQTIICIDGYSGGHSNYWLQRLFAYTVIITKSKPHGIYLMIFFLRHVFTKLFFFVGLGPRVKYTLFQDYIFGCVFFLS